MKLIDKCRVCSSERLTGYLDLGLMPLSNNLEPTLAQAMTAKRYPLKVMLCENCGLSQLSVVVDPHLLFDNYVYRSSISQTYKNHCFEMASELVNFMSFEAFDRNWIPGSIQHIDIAGNDGALISEFKQAIKNIPYYGLNVDPAQNLRSMNTLQDIPMYNEYWNSTTAKKIVNGGLLKSGGSKSTFKEQDARANIITATNVFAHVDDVTDFLFACKIALQPFGIIVLEFPYLIDFITHREFDTVYFEHLSYFSIFPLKLLVKSLGLNIMNVTKQDIHGGSVRVIIGYGQPDGTAEKFLVDEIKDWRAIEPYYEFAYSVNSTIKDFRRNIIALNGKVAAFGASAKGNTLLNAADITFALIQYIVDETPEKIGKYSPGTGIPIVSMDMLKNEPPDYLVILSWNFKHEIVRKCLDAGYKGKFIIPIPKFYIV